MKHRASAWTALAVSLSLTAAPGARAAEAQFNIMGPSTCMGWPKSGTIDSAAKAVSLNWALGFLSGWAAFSNLALLNVIEPKEIDAWLTTYCQDHPMDALPIAIRELERDLEKKLPPPPPPPEPPAPPQVAAPAPTAETSAAKPKPKPKATTRRSTTRRKR
jgi:hypothetical protein